MYTTLHRDMIKLQMQNMHKTTHDRHLTGVHWPINRGRVWGSRVVYNPTQRPDLGLSSLGAALITTDYILVNLVYFNREFN